MRWIGAVAGAVLGSARGGGIVGGLIGSVIGNWVEDKVRDCLGKPASGKARRQESSVQSKPDTPRSPYDILGVSPDAPDEEVKRAYRGKVKHLHPDALRSKGLPDEVIATVNDQMARINAAWEAIKRERRFSGRSV